MHKMVAISLNSFSPKSHSFIRQIVSMLKVPRFELGITVETKGKVGGSLTFFSQEKMQVVECRNESVNIEEGILDIQIDKEVDVIEVIKSSSWSSWRCISFN